MHKLYESPFGLLFGVLLTIPLFLALWLLATLWVLIEDIAKGKD